MANRDMKRGSISLIIREMQIKTQWQIISHLLRRTAIKRQKITHFDRRRRGPLTLLLVGSYLKNSMEFPLKIKNNLKWSVVPLLDIWSNETEICLSGDITLPKLVTALFTIAKIMKEPKNLFMGDWIKKLWYRPPHTYAMEYYSVLKGEGNFAVCDNLDEPDGHYANWNKPERKRKKDKYFMI